MSTTTTAPRALDDDAKKAAEALSIANGGATVQHNPKTGKLAVTRPPSTLTQALQVLKGRRRPMTAQEIYDTGIAKGLFASLKGATPVATLSAKLAMANKTGGPVVRPEPGRYQLRRTEA